MGLHDGAIVQDALSVTVQLLRGAQEHRLQHLGAVICGHWCDPSLLRPSFDSRALNWLYTELLGYEVNRAMSREPIAVNRLKTKPVSSIFDEDELHAIDEWRRAQIDLPSRSEAIRRLVKTGIQTTGRKRATKEMGGPSSRGRLR